MLKYQVFSTLILLLASVLMVLPVVAGQGTAEIRGTVVSVNHDSGDIMVEDNEGDVL